VTCPRSFSICSLQLLTAYAVPLTYLKPAVVYAQVLYPALERLMAGPEWGEWAADIAQTHYDEAAMSKFLAAHAKFKVVQDELAARRAAADAEAARQAEAARLAAEDAAVAWDADGETVQLRDADEDEEDIWEEEYFEEVVDSKAQRADDEDDEEVPSPDDEEARAESFGRSQGGDGKVPNLEQMFASGEDRLGASRNGAPAVGASGALGDSELPVVEGLGDAGLTGLLAPSREPVAGPPAQGSTAEGQASRAAVGVPSGLAGSNGAAGIGNGQGLAGGVETGGRSSLRVSTGLFGQATNGAAGGQNGVEEGLNGVAKPSPARPPQAPMSK
jgi:hypothetical protein